MVITNRCLLNWTWKLLAAPQPPYLFVDDLHFKLSIIVPPCALELYHRIKEFTQSCTFVASKMEDLVDRMCLDKRKLKEEDLGASRLTK